MVGCCAGVCWLPGRKFFEALDPCCGLGPVGEEEGTWDSEKEKRFFFVLQQLQDRSLPFLYYRVQNSIFSPPPRYHFRTFFFFCSPPLLHPNCP